MDQDRKKDMKKIITVLALCAMLFALCSSAEAQQAGKVLRIGLLDPSDARSSVVRLEPFLAGDPQTWMDPRSSNYSPRQDLAGELCQHLVIGGE